MCWLDVMDKLCFKTQVDHFDTFFTLLSPPHTQLSQFQKQRKTALWEDDVMSHSVIKQNVRKTQL